MCQAPCRRERAQADGAGVRRDQAALAERVDVKPNALYRHVASNTALIDEILDDVLADPPERPHVKHAGAGWTH
jgi:hypothetical protein